ncbi:DUF1707 domain-containing protein [Haloactinopolyspora sp.]|jgi:hypothetical protein|uniref:DUF1707 SHOCT-like domain-containing protein n=1 Tax=Haloactinopolyspora sp. TaxID=1966353 RepID=UPI00261820EB|nr:DUF1707 domain-containing protein [Haloactinopolyspora sp.]
MADRHEMRAADSDRERVTEILRDAHGEGRLRQDELLARIELAYNARTYSELDQLIADLPVQPRQATAPARPVSVTPPANRGGTMRRLVRGTLNAAWWFYGVAVAINLTVWLLVSMGDGFPEYFWPAWVAGPWGVVLATAELTYRRRTSRTQR